VYDPKLIKEFRRGLGMYWITVCISVVESRMLAFWDLELQNSINGVFYTVT
jgi:hypothetical protein